MSCVIACGILNVLFCVTDYLMAITLGLSWYVSEIFFHRRSSSKKFTEPPHEDGLVPENCSTILI